MASAPMASWAFWISGSQMVTASTSPAFSARAMWLNGNIGTTVTSESLSPAVASIRCR